MQEESATDPSLTATFRKNDLFPIPGRDLRKPAKRRSIGNESSI